MTKTETLQNLEQKQKLFKKGYEELEGDIFDSILERIVNRDYEFEHYEYSDFLIELKLKYHNVFDLLESCEEEVVDSCKEKIDEVVNLITNYSYEGLIERLRDQND